MKVDVLIVGGGFFGCSLGIHLANKNKDAKVLIVEQYNDLLQKASLVNQARVHTGFHYPRSKETLLSCLANYTKFLTDYSECVDSTFKNYYALAKDGTKISAKDYYNLYKEFEAPIEVANSNDSIRSLINMDLVEEVFQVKEFAFDSIKLKSLLKKKIKQTKNLMYRLNTRVERIEDSKVFTTIGKIEVSEIYLCTYSGNNAILLESKLKPLDLTYEVAELCKLEVPQEFRDKAITVMDGPFFSLYPYPAEKCHTLAHVVHTVRKSSKSEISLIKTKKSSIFEMINDSKRFVPTIAESKYLGSITEIKALLPRNESDDGRPILFKQQEDNPRVFNVIGGKLDNVYDLFNVLDNKVGLNVNFLENSK